MPAEYHEIKELLTRKSELNARLKLMPYIGTPEIKKRDSGKYLYVRNRILGKKTSTYVGVYTDDLYNLLVHNANEIRIIKRELRKIEQELAEKGYQGNNLSKGILSNIDFASANMGSNIYDQAVLEGISISYMQTEEILQNQKIYGVTSSDVQKILNLKHAWEFILDKDVLTSKTDYYLLSHIAKLVNESFFNQGGRMRVVPVRIGGSSYIPPLPIEADVKDRINEIVTEDASPIDTAIKLSLYCMKTQVFVDGNKRASIIFANHYLISHAGGALVIPEKEVPEFKRLLVRYYEGEDIEQISQFMKNCCWRKFSI